MTDNRYNLTIENGIITDIEMMKILEPKADGSLPDYEEIKACLFIPKEVVGFSDDPVFLESLIGFDPLTIEVEKGNEVYESKYNCLIRKRDKTIVLGCSNSYIPSDGSVEHIGNNVLSAPIEPKEIDLGNFNIPDGIKTIGYRAFANSSEEGICITVPETVEKVETMAFMMHPAEDSNCIIVFYGSPELEPGVFGTKAESVDSCYTAYKELPDILYSKPEQLFIRCLKNSTVEEYCKRYGIPFEIINEYYEDVIHAIFLDRNIKIDFTDEFYSAFDDILNSLSKTDKQVLIDVYLKRRLNRALRIVRNPKRSKKLKPFMHFGSE